MNAEDTTAAVESQGWTIHAEVLPWEPLFVGPVIDVIMGVVDRADAVLARPYGWSGRIAESEPVAAIAAFLLATTLGVVELVVLAVVWPLWWGYRRLAGAPLNLVIHDPEGAFVPTPKDLGAWSIRDRREEVRQRIGSGRLRAQPVAADRSDLRCAGPGQPLVRRTRPVRTTTGRA